MTSLINHLIDVWQQEAAYKIDHFVINGNIPEDMAGILRVADPPEKWHIVEIESKSQVRSKSLTFLSISPDLTSTVYAEPFDFLIKQNRSWEDNSLVHIQFQN